MALTLVIGNKNYSSWSLRPWLALRAAGIAFAETRISLYTPEAKQEILRYSPAGKVPILIDGDVTVWDSLAILEYLAERFPQHKLWPDDAAPRARARALCAEMHSGFPAMRSELCMNLRRTFSTHAATPEALADITRVQTIWTQCLAQSGGPFLFGAFGNADAMYAPVVTRFLTYSVRTEHVLRRYMDTVRALPAMHEWYRAAASETELLPQFERQA